jgi:iron complex outermembrane recepter protein
VRKAIIAAVCCSLTGLSIAADANASVKMPTDIPAESLDEALKSLAKERGLQFVYRSDVVGRARTPGVRGNLTTSEALTGLLEGTSLGYLYLDSNTITVLRRVDLQSAATESVSGSSAQVQGVNDGGESSVWDRLLLAQVSSGASAADAVTPGSPAAPDNTSRLDEVVVTAQKKTERLQDVPVPVTVVNTDELANNGAGRIQDFYTTVPGLTLIGNPYGGGGGGTQQVTIRGLNTTSSGNPTVGFLIDDVPFGSSSSALLGQMGYPDIDPSDLSDIEVLKGPQGTLYGADSLGGLIKITTKDPTTDAFSGHAQVLGEDVPDGDEGYAVRASANIPISNEFAIRISGFSRRDPGYIDNLTTGEDNVNATEVNGGRISALWRLTDDVTLKIAALYQHTDGDGPSIVTTNSLLQPVLGDLKQVGIPGSGGYVGEVELYTATLNAKIAGLDLTSITGYGFNRWSNVVDFSEFAPFYSTPFFPGAAGSIIDTDASVHNISQEVRLSSSISTWLDWLTGVFYTHQSGNLAQDIEAADSTTGAVVGQSVDSNPTETTLWESAAFAEATTHITDHFDFQFGARESWNHLSSYSETTGAAVETFYGASPYIPPPQAADGHAFTYLITPDYKISPDLMIYARIASGYRIGGSNFPRPGVPLSYKPDTTTDYEIGIKSDFFDHALTVDASAYYIDWKDIQLEANQSGTGTCNCSFETNGATAKSEGLELAVEAHPAPGTKVSLNGSFNNAVLTQDLPAEAVNAGAYAVAGDRLPYSARASGSIGIEQDIFHFADGTVAAGADGAYVSARSSEFTAEGTPRLVYPAYFALNLHVGAHYGPWQYNLFLNNVGDKRGIIGGSNTFTGEEPRYYAAIIQPRTVGLSIDRSF